MIRSMLEEWGHVVSECSDGASAVEMYRRHSPDMVLMDIEMRPVDGITATKLITRFDPRAKVTMVTQYGDNDSREEAMKAGAHHFILKENLIELKKLIQTALT